MDHPLDDAYRKVVRAQRQIKALDGEIMAWAPKNPLEFALGRNPFTGEMRARIPQPPILPKDWGDTVGEIAHNLRSALDYVVFQITEGGEGAGTAFPIGKGKRSYFKAKGKGKSYKEKCLPGVPEKWAVWIDQLQPFQSPLPPDKPHELAILNVLSNRDKHRHGVHVLSIIELPFTYLTVESGALVKDIELRSSADGRDLQIEHQTRTPAGKGQKLITGFDPKIPPDDRSGGVSIAFSKDRIRLENLWLVAGHVEFIVRSFYPAFEGD